MSWRSRKPGTETSWALTPAAQWAREGILMYALRPIVEHYTHPEVRGIEVLDGLKPPVIFAANHSSHLDTPTILRALPKEWRRKTVTVAAADYFFQNKMLATAVALAFAAVPIDRKGGLGKDTAGRFERLFEASWNVLLYPEGTRSRTGAMGRLRSGAAFFAVEHRLPVVPVYLTGTRAAMPVGRPWPRKHDVKLTFGPPLYPAPGEDHRSVTARLQSALKDLGAEIGSFAIEPDTLL